MLGKQDFMVIQALVQRGGYICDVARQLVVHPKTVGRALARRGAPRPTRRTRKRLLHPYRAHLDQLLGEGVWNAQVIFRELQARGYTGKLSILRDEIRPKRVLRPGRVTVWFETEPGRQLPSDWGAMRTIIGGSEIQVHFCVNALGYSRRFHFWCTDREDAEHTYEGLIPQLRMVWRRERRGPGRQACPTRWRAAGYGCALPSRAPWRSTMPSRRSRSIGSGQRLRAG